MDDPTTIKTDESLKIDDNLKIDDTPEPVVPPKPDALANVWRVDFGKFQYFPTTKELKQGENIQKLASSPAALLELLIKQGGKPILRQEIVKIVWLGKEEVLVASFYQVVQRLRAALDDAVEPRRVIMNALKNAYALQPRITLRYKKTKKQRRIRLLANIMFYLTLSGSALAYIFWPPPAKIAHYNAIEYQSISSLRGQIQTPAASSDSTIVMFSHKTLGSKGWSLMAKRVGTQETALLVPFNDSQHNDEPAFSPSGRQVSWVANDHKTNANCQIMIADFSPESLTLSNQRMALDCSVYPYGRTPQWRTEDTLLVSLTAKLGKPSGIVEFNLSSEEQTIITAPSDYGYGDYGLFYNDSADKIAYIRQSSSTGTGTELRVYDFSTSSDILIKSYDYSLYTVAWTDENRLLTNAKNGFEVLSLNGKVFPVYSDNIDPENFPFTLGDNRIGLVKGELYGRDIKVIDLNNKTTNSRLSSISHDYRAVIAKDSEDIAFISERNAKSQVFVTNNQRLSQITNFDEDSFIIDMAISSNGELIVMAEGNQLTILNKEADIIYQSPVSVNGMSFSPDDSRLVFGITLENAKLIKQLNLDDLTETTITDGFMPKFDEKGELYFFRSLKQTKMPLLHKITEYGGVVDLFEPPFQLVNSNSFDIINNQIYYVTEDENKDLILASENLTSREIKTITPITHRKFSLNKDATKVVTTEQGVVQNNLASFTLVEEKVDEGKNASPDLN